MSCLMVHWFERMARRGIISPGSSMMEFGPQDFDVPDDVLKGVTQRLLSDEQREALLPKVFDALAHRRSRYHGDFYRLFGVSSYQSLDPFDAAADYRYDLNYFVPIFRKYDVVTNFGTSEHVFETARVYRTAHRLLKRDGLLLLVLPAYGDIDHGFFNVHPVLYRTMAQHSGYDIADLHYIDDIAVRTRRQFSLPNEHFDFDGLPIKLADMSNEAQFKRKVMVRFVHNGQKRLGTDGEGMPDVFDYCFVALRKRASGPLRRPYQYSTKPPSTMVNAWALLSLPARRVAGIRVAKDFVHKLRDRIPAGAKARIRKMLGPFRT